MSKVIDFKQNKEEPISNINDLNFTVSYPKRNIPKKLTREDVWGNGLYNRDVPRTTENMGMRVTVAEEFSPIFNRILPSKTTVFVGAKSKEQEISYWIEYVYGMNSIYEVKEIDDLRIAIMAAYNCH